MLHDRPVEAGSVFLSDCPARLAIDIITNKWAVVVLFALSRRPRRHGELVLADRALNHRAEQARVDARAVAPVSATVAGRPVLLIPQRRGLQGRAAQQLPQDPGDRAGGRRPGSGQGSRRRRPPN